MGLFKGRSFQVKLVKDADKADEQTPDIPTADYVSLAMSGADLLANKIIVGVVAYVAADTVRQVIINKTMPRPF